jgi:ubiquinone/menaquinone biosynthesis C-methylase UbiE
MGKTAKRKSSKSTVIEGDVKEFWDQQAKQHGGSDLATAPDHHYRTLEIDTILRVIEGMPHENILDVGCGNGYTTRAIAKKFPEATVTGVDFSGEMVKEANKLATPNAEFFEGDVLSLSRNPMLITGNYDVVISTRCLINLANWEEQKIGILEMRKLLSKEGKLVLVENVQEGLDNLNAVRTKMGLDPIKVRWHNKYLPQTEIRKFFEDIRGHLLTTEYVENIGNMYYIASRVIYAKLCKDQGIEPDYNNPINQIASQLPTMGEYYACSPNFLFILKNEAGHGASGN